MPESVERQVEVEATAEELWAALTDADELGAWFGGRMQIEARPGGRVTLDGADGERRHGSVEVVERPTLLVFRWFATTGQVAGSGTRVEFRLDSRGERTLLTVIETPMTSALAAV